MRLVATGELAGSATAIQMPNIGGKMVRLKAAYDNAGRVYVGLTGVTVKDGTTDVTSGLEMNAGDAEWFFLNGNFNELYRICNNAGDDLTYAVFQ